MGALEVERLEGHVLFKVACIRALARFLAPIQLLARFLVENLTRIPTYVLVFLIFVNAI